MQNENRKGNITADAHRRWPRRFCQEGTPITKRKHGKKHHGRRPSTMAKSILSGSDACHETKKKEKDITADAHRRWPSRFCQEVTPVAKRRKENIPANAHRRWPRRFCQEVTSVAKRRQGTKHHSRCPPTMAKSIPSGSDVCHKTKKMTEPSQPMPIGKGHVDSVRK